jgi:diguanylate cyclase (GGDEF)-like protein
MGNYDDWALGRDSPFKDRLASVRSKDLAPNPAKVVRKITPSNPIDYLERLGTASGSNRSATPDEERRVLLDDLTELTNFKTFMKTLVYELKRGERYKRPLAVCTVSIDGLENIKRQFGPDTANHIIKHVAQVLRAVIRDVDIPARHNETSFVILFPETNSSGITSVAERIRQRIRSQPITFAMQEHYVTVSIGGAAFPAHARTAEDILARATQAEIVAEQRGGDRVCVA